MLSPSADNPVTFGRYRLFEEIGRGGMAMVYRAEMQGVGGFSKLVALKVIRPELIEGDREFVRQFINEARLGGYLSHNNIVETLDFGETDGQLYMAMEYVVGPTLQHVWEGSRRGHKPIPPPVAFEIIHQVLEGLTEAHRAKDANGRPLNLVHRDMKPSNIFVARSGTVKVGDFGVARAESNVMRTLHGGAIKGTVRYMSPEQAWGNADLDHRSDLFSVASILFELLASRHLYEGDRYHTVMRMAQDGTIPDLETCLPAECLTLGIPELLRTGLAAEPDQRFPTARAMGSAVDKVRARLKRVKLGSWLKRNAYLWDPTAPRPDSARMPGPGASTSAPTQIPGVGPAPLPSAFPSQGGSAKAGFNIFSLEPEGEVGKTGVRPVAQAPGVQPPSTAAPTSPGVAGDAFARPARDQSEEKTLSPWSDNGFPILNRNDPYGRFGDEEVDHSEVVTRQYDISQLLADRRREEAEARTELHTALREDTEPSLEREPTLTLDQEVAPEEDAPEERFPEDEPPPAAPAPKGGMTVGRALIFGALAVGILAGAAWLMTATVEIDPPRSSDGPGDVGADGAGPPRPAPEAPAEEPEGAVDPPAQPAGQRPGRGGATGGTRRGSQADDAPQAPGRLFLNTFPPGHIAVDGTPISGSRLKDFTLQAGSHEITVAWGQGAALSDTIVVEPGKRHYCVAESGGEKLKCE